MCGLFAIWADKYDVRMTAAKKAVKIQAHRGPDHQQIDDYGQITFAHNRLSIIDISVDANQPISSRCGMYSIIFNGEIYNYLELRSETDYEYRTSSDTEVILALYIKHGTDCLKYLNGMFAFAIYDRTRNLIFCARDRVGEKPLLYSEAANIFMIASELPAIASSGLLKLSEDPIGISYSTLRNLRHIPEPYTKYREIRRLEPAHAMIIKDKKIVKKWCYWSFDTKCESSITREDVASIIEDSVRIRERADVEVGALLSGGVDSSIICGLMAKHGLYPNAYTLHSDEEELSRAKYVSQLFKIPLHIINFSEVEQQAMRKNFASTYGEEVRLTSLGHAGQLYSRIRDDNIKVVMTGVGADEIFFGYDGTRRQLIFSDLLTLVEKLPTFWLEKFSSLFRSHSSLELLWSMARLENSKRKGFLYNREALRKGYGDEFDYGAIFEYWANLFPFENYIESSNFMGLILENAHSITISSDLVPMHFSVEARAPFLDHRVIELGFKIQAKYKTSSYIGKVNNKRILKEAFSTLLPPEILYAKKKGFGYALGEFYK